MGLRHSRRHKETWHDLADSGKLLREQMAKPYISAMCYHERKRDNKREEWERDREIGGREREGRERKR